MKKIKKIYTVKTFDELTDDEKQSKINLYSESILTDWNNMMYDDFKFKLDDINYRYSDIFELDDLYLDENSQGWWIDKIVNFKCKSSIKIYGEDLWINDIDFHIRKTIDDISSNDIYIDDYYLNDDLLTKIQNTKKYKNWINNLVLKFNEFKDELNQSVIDYFKNEYNVDPEFVNEFMQDMEFEYLECVEDC